MKNTLFIDQGNSESKWLLNGEFRRFGNTELNSQIFFDFIKQSLANIDEVYISSVNQSAYDNIKVALKGKNITDVATLLTQQKLIDFSSIEGMGIDRKLGLIGALEFRNPSLATLDCGTAITLNILDQDFKCLGGLIGIGVKTQVKALAEFTSLLPQIELHPSIQFPAKNTIEAINAGVLISIKGTINQIVLLLQEHEIYNLIITGGDSRFIMELLEDSRLNVLQEKNLVLYGIKQLVTNCKKALQ